MNKLVKAVLVALLPLSALAAGGGAHLESADIDLGDQAAMQRGAKYFMNYCAGCHSLKYARYNRMARDLGLTEEQVLDNLVFTAGTKPGDNISIALRPKDGEAFFGTAVPDLTLVTRNKKGGPDWLYTYLKSFYLDDSRPYGVNNTVFPEVGMPDVLWRLRGTQKAVYNESTDAAGNPVQVFDHFEPVSQGSMSPEEFDTAVRDLTTFLAYMGEPMKTERQSLGLYVILFLVVFSVLAYLLKKEYWRDVH
jgi:ubiquinol-cytochrome c reductase cytochrome c1 subunit